jgi:hypothetical protein
MTGMRTPLLLLVLAAFLSSTEASARVEGRFLSLIGMVAVTDRILGQVTDDDPQRLFALMNVELTDGRAKSIKLADRKFSLVCTDRGGGQILCSMVVKSGPQGPYPRGTV